MTSKRTWSGLTSALGLAAGLYLVYLGVSGAISGARNQNWVWLLFNLLVVGLFGGMLLAGTVRRLKQHSATKSDDEAA
jgi:hypothetical protein